MICLVLTAPLWLWSECLDHPSQLDAGWRALRDIRKRMLEDIQHMWCCLDMAKHICLAIVVFLESLADGRARRLGMACAVVLVLAVGGGRCCARPRICF